MKRMHKTADAIEATLDAELRLLISRDALTALAGEPLPDLDQPFIDVDVVGIAAPAVLSGSGPRTHRRTTATPVGRTLRTTIRLPRDVVEAFKARAATEGRPYQRLIGRALREWLATAAGAP